MDRGSWEGETRSTGVEDEVRGEGDGMGECVGEEEEEKFLA